MALGLIGPIGVPELITLLFMLAPLIILIWALRTLLEVRRTQELLLQRLSQLEERLRQPAR